jgi:hypothetical protein
VDVPDEMVLEVFSYMDMFSTYTFFFLVYTMVCIGFGVVIGFLLRREYFNESLRIVVDWAKQQVGIARGRVEFVDDWDPETNSLKTFRVLEDPSDAESDEVFFVNNDQSLGVHKLIRPNRILRRRYPAIIVFWRKMGCVLLKKLGERRRTRLRTWKWMTKVMLTVPAPWIPFR